ncbi:MAG: hypothetical protein O7F12_01490 [Nitrospirae bacterium]|nr:hypothetical protein [Nitrospirota bacterium]
MDEKPKHQDPQPLPYLHDRSECDLRKRIKKTLEKANQLLADCGKAVDSSTSSENSSPPPDSSKN